MSQGGASPHSIVCKMKPLRKRRLNKEAMLDEQCPNTFMR